MTLYKPVILAIEDDPDFRKGLEAVLSRFGLTIHGVSNTQDFLRAADNLKPDLYLVDLQLGKENGFDLIQKLRLEKKVKEPIVVVSGARQAAAVSHALELGASDYIMKPLDRSFLASKLSRFLDTDEMKEHRSELRELPDGKVPARLGVEGRIVEVDELGVLIQTKSLIPKLTVFKLSSDFFTTIGTKQRECLCTVTSTLFEADKKLYSIYAEFDGVDADFLRDVRRWLSG